MDRVKAMMKDESLVALLELKKTDLSAALDGLGELCHQTVTKYGDFAPECAPVHYEYGSACLQYAEESADIFGDTVIQKTSEEEQLRASESSNGEPSTTNYAVAAASAFQAATNCDEEAEQTTVEKTDEAPEENDGDAKADFDIDEILEGLIQAYKEKTGDEPTDEVLQQWMGEIKGAAGLLATASDASKPSAEEASSSASAAPSTSADAASSSTSADVGSSSTSADVGSSSSSTDAPSASATADAASLFSNVKPPQEVIEAAQQAMNEHQAANETVAEFLEIAWQTIDLARVVYEKLMEANPSSDEQTDLLKHISRCLLRLGDLNMETGSFDVSVSDYDKCLQIRERVFEPSSRELADVHASLANACLYASSEDKDALSAKEKRIKGLKHYTAAGRILGAYRKSLIGVLALNADATTTANSSASDAGKGRAPGMEAIQACQVKHSRAVVKTIKEDSKATYPQLTTASEETIEKFNQLGEILLEVKDKIEDVIETIENPEASDAMSKAKQVVETAIESATNASSSFDAPTLPTDGHVATLTAKSTKVNSLTPMSSNAPKNLKQARNLAGSNEDVATVTAGLKRKVDDQDGPKSSEDATSAPKKVAVVNQDGTDGDVVVK